MTNMEKKRRKLEGERKRRTKGRERQNSLFPQRFRTNRFCFLLVLIGWKNLVLIVGSNPVHIRSLVLLINNYIFTNCPQITVNDEHLVKLNILIVLFI